MFLRKNFSIPFCMDFSMAFSKWLSRTSFLLVWDSKRGLGIVTPTMNVMPVRTSLSLTDNFSFFALRSSFSLIELTKILRKRSWWEPPVKGGGRG